MQALENLITTFEFSSTFPADKNGPKDYAKHAIIERVRKRYGYEPSRQAREQIDELYTNNKGHVSLGLAHTAQGFVISYQADVFAEEQASKQYRRIDTNA